MTGAPIGSLYDRLGGGAGIRAVVDRFYELVLQDPMLLPFFAGVDLARLRRHQALFLGRVAGGPSPAEEAGVAQAHAGRGIDDAAFDRVTYYLSVALHEHEATAREIDEVLGAVRRLRATVVGPPGPDYRM